MPEHEALLTDAEITDISPYHEYHKRAIANAQHAKTLAWADARKVKCPCLCHRSDPRLCATTSTDAREQSLCGCHGSGEVTWGDMVNEGGA